MSVGVIRNMGSADVKNRNLILEQWTKSNTASTSTVSQTETSLKLTFNSTTQNNAGGYAYLTIGVDVTNYKTLRVFGKAKRANGGVGEFYNPSLLLSDVYVYHNMTSLQNWEETFAVDYDISAMSGLQELMMRVTGYQDHGTQVNVGAYIELTTCELIK